MPLGVLFWVLYVLAFFFSGWSYYGQPNWVKPFSGVLVLWVLVGILGYHAFGPVVR